MNRAFCMLFVFLLAVGAVGPLRQHVEAQDLSALKARKATAASKIQLFGSREIRSRSVKSFNKWTEMWRRHNLPREETTAPEDKTPPKTRLKCIGAARLECGRADWEKFVNESSGLDVEALLPKVNEYMNRSPYIVDPVNWGIPDYWATPDEFFLKDGDCEDYAISKYVTLKRLGVDPSIMRLVILQDENLRAAHAILAVQINGVYMILDNQVNSVLPDTKILHYRPVYSLNESGWWLHHKRRFVPK
jgi:predicted transglutaminase-like cysteine proteinase